MIVKYWFLTSVFSQRQLNTTKNLDENIKSHLTNLNLYNDNAAFD